MSTTRALIFANGCLPGVQNILSQVQSGDILIAANGGTHHVLSLGLIPSVIIGDLDSLPTGLMDKIKTSSTVIIPHPRDKQETDLELALQYAIEKGYAPIIVIAALGSRIDQTIGNLSLLTSPELAEMDIRMDDGQEEVFFIRSRAILQGCAGDIVSLLPWGMPVRGVKTSGLKWSLHGETLHPSKTRGISNEMLGNTASVQIKTGLLLAIHSRM